MEPLLPGTIVCWSIELDQPDEEVAPLGDVLAAAERERASRFVFGRDRRRFIVTRACLRAVLGAAIGERPESVSLSYGERGKPLLALQPPARPVHFSVSHSEGLALIALTLDGPLGIDLEALRPLTDLMSIARRYFTAAEAQAISGVPCAERTQAFFLCWTRKEAFAKALGDGLARPLDSYLVSCRPGEPARLLEIDGSAVEASRWSMYDVRPAPGFVGAATMRAPRLPLTLARLDIAVDVLPRLSR